MEGNGWGNEAKGRPKSPRNGANGGGGRRGTGMPVGKKGNTPSSYILPKSFSNSQPFRGDSSRRRNIFSFPIRPSSRQPSDCHRHAVTDARIYVGYARLCAPPTDVVLCYSTSISPLRPPYCSTNTASPLPAPPLLSPSARSHDSSLFFIRIS